MDTPCHIRIEDDDVLRGERLTRSLHEMLHHIEGLQVRLTTVGNEASALSKGLDAGAILIVAVVAFRHGLTPVLVKALESWSQRERDQTVIIQRGDTRIEIRGTGNAKNLEAVQKLLER